VVEEGYAAFCELFRGEYETLHDWMTCLADDRGVRRQTSSLTIFVEDGSWKGCLTDKDANKCLFITAPTLYGVLMKMDEALVSGNADWRKRWGGPAKGKSK